MKLVRRKKPSLEKRERELSTELSALSDKIEALEKKLHPKTSTLKSEKQKARAEKNSAHEPEQPLFEEPSVTHVGDIKRSEPAPELFNEDGVRKFNLPAAWTRLKQFINGPQAQNTKFVSHLTKGSPHGLPPLRREKRMARQRFLIMFTALLLILWFVSSVYLGTR